MNDPSNPAAKYEIEPKPSVREASSVSVSMPSARSVARVGAIGMATVVDTPVDSGRYESIYQSAAGDPSLVPWARQQPNPMMVCWLNAEAPGLVRPGSRVVVVGCGLGDDVAELISRGYDAVGFDVSPTAVSWARKRFPDHAAQFSVTDLFALPGKFRHRFDLVIEIHTLQALDPAQRERAAAAVASLAGPQGHVVAICRGREESQLLEFVQGPPWPLTRSELLGLMESSGLRPLREIDEFMDEETPPQRRLRGVFLRA